MTQRAINWALALLIIAIMVAAQCLDGPDDIETERTVAADLADAQAQAQARQVQP